MVIFTEVWNGIVGIFNFVVSEPLSALVILLWIVISVVSARAEGKSIFVKLIKNFFVMIILAILYSAAPLLFWILIGSVVVIAVYLAIVGG